jgi:DNA-directed RNA polymerase specialized sigma24 family protein
VTDEVEGYEELAAELGPRLYEALVPVAGIDRAHDATSDALLYAWRNWDRVGTLDNPAGYLYVMARRHATRGRPLNRTLLPQLAPTELPEVEPALLGALERLSEMQRQVVYLVEGFGWGLTDVSRILGISVSTVRNHLARGLDNLRTALQVTDPADSNPSATTRQEGTSHA